MQATLGVPLTAVTFRICSTTTNYFNRWFISALCFRYDVVFGLEVVRVSRTLSETGKDDPVFCIRERVVSAPTRRSFLPRRQLQDTTPNTRTLLFLAISAIVIF